jgi:glycosyltransferase involved in cell wall biosynthesis
MRTRVAQFELHAPADIWGLEGYGAVEVLVRDEGVPVGKLHIQIYRGDAVLTAEVVRQLATDAGLTHSTERMPADNSARPSISVVVCTRDRPLALRRCLESMQLLRYENFEVLIVDNASRCSETRLLVAETSFRYLREDRPGLDWARNRGLHAAVNEVVAYTDDDVRVDPNWLNGIATGFRDSQVACVTGLVCPLELETPAQVLFEQYGGMGKGLRARLFDPAKLLPEELIAAHSAGVGANMAFRRDALIQLGGFDVHLDVGTPSNGGGDLDIFHRVLTAGRIIRYEPNALVWHQHRRSLPGLHTQVCNNGRAFGCYLLKIAGNRTVSRTKVATSAAKNWFGSWLLGSLFSGRPGRTPTLVAAELWGALYSPRAYWKTYRRAPLLSRVSLEANDQ